MDELNILVIAIYMTIILSGWIKSRANMQGLDRLYNKKLRYENNHLNFQKSILRDGTPFGSQIKKKLGIISKTINFLSRWKEILKKQKEVLTNF